MSVTEVKSPRLREGERTRVDCGGISFVRGYAGERVRVRGQMVAKDYSKGFLYDFEEGASFQIPAVVEWNRK